MMKHLSHSVRKIRRGLSAYELILLALVVTGVALRAIDLTDPPLDFHAWRQLRSAAIARGVYYQLESGADPATRKLALDLAEFEPLEPPLFEYLVGTTNALLGRDLLWTARAYAIAFWMLGGVALFSLARALTSQAGALAALALYLFLPFSVTASRAFLPDVPMTAFTILAMLFIEKWTRDSRAIWAILAGVLAGTAILIKVFAVFPLAAFTLALGLSRLRLSAALRRPQLWTFGILAVAIPAAYYFLARGTAATDYLRGWVFPFSRLLADPRFYGRWAITLHRTVGLPAVLLGLIGLAVCRTQVRPALIGMWVGYGLFGVAVPSLIISHSYYQTILVPIVALSFAPFGSWLFRTAISGSSRTKVVFGGLAAAALLAMSWKSMSVMVENDYRAEVLGWAKIGRELPRDGRIIGLSHDYNTRVRYYGWRKVAQWPHATDFDMQVLAGGNYDPEDPGLAANFENRLADYDYFLVTLFEELELQPVLKQVLYDGSTVIDGDGYLLFDLSQAP